MADVTLSAATILDALQGYLKEDYTVHGLTDMINREAEFFGKVRRTGKDVRGKYAVIPVLLQGNRNAVGSRNESDDLPSPGFQQTATDGSSRTYGQVEMKYNTGRLAISEAAIQASAKSQGAFESALEVEMQGLARDMGNDLNRQHIAGDGTGKLCQVGTVDGSVLDVWQPGGQTCWPEASDGDGAKYLEVGDVVAVYNGSTFVQTSDITAIDYSSTPNTITLDTAGSVADGHFVYKGSKDGVADELDDNKDSDVEGLGLWVDDDSTAASINPATAGNERWAATVLDHTAAPVQLSESLMHQMTSLIRRRGGQAASKSLALWTTYAIENDYGSRILTPDKRYSNTTTLSGGYTALTFNGVPLMVDKDCLPGHMYFLTMSELFCYNQGGFYWMDRDNMFSRVADKMAWEATLLFFSNFGTPRRNVHGVIRGIQEPYRVDMFNS